MAQPRSRKRQRGSGAGGAASGGLGDTPALGGAGGARDAATTPPVAARDAATTPPVAARDAATTPPVADPAAPAPAPVPDEATIREYGAPEGASRPSRSERTEQKNAAVRAELQPLAAGERPGAVTVAAVVAVVLAVLVVVGYATGARVGGEGSLVGALLLAAILLVAAWGMWNVRYWAVLGFEALLAFQLVVASLSLAVASNWWAALLCVALIGFGGWLFWKLIRAMARIQMPERPSAP